MTDLTDKATPDPKTVPRAMMGDEGGMDYLQSIPYKVVVVYMPLAIFLFVLLFPFYWMSLTAFKTTDELHAVKGIGSLWLFDPTLENIKYLLFETDFGSWAWNTLLITFSATFLSIFCAVCAAYAIERIRYRGSRYIGMAIFLAYLVPPSILFIPLSVMVFQLGVFDTSWALILTYPTILVPFCTWLLMGYFRSIPYELEECALIDGATRFQILTKIILPLSVPGLISAGIFALPGLERVHLRPHLHRLGGEQDRAGGSGHGDDHLRRVQLGRVDGRCAGGFAAGGDLLLVLRGLLRLVDDRSGEGVMPAVAMA